MDEKNQIEYDGARYSVTGLARKILIEQYGWAKSLHVNGWRYFTKNGVTLSDMRDSIDSTAGDEG